MGFTVYQHLFPNGKSYVGITNQKVNRRWRSGKGYSFNVRLTNAINKYGWNNIEHIILAEDLTEEDACIMEVKLIDEMNLTNPECGYNYAIGGIHPPHSDETKRKIGEKSKGRKHTEEFKQWISNKNSGEKNFMYGKHHSDETKQKISNAKKGKAISPNKGKFRKDHPSSKSVAGLNPVTDEVVVIYPSIIDASEGIGRSKSCIQAALHGKQKTCADLKWVYL